MNNTVYQTVYMQTFVAAVQFVLCLKLNNSVATYLQPFPLFNTIFYQMSSSGLVGVLGIPPVAVSFGFHGLSCSLVLKGCWGFPLSFPLVIHWSVEVAVAHVSPCGSAITSHGRRGHCKARRILWPDKRRKSVTCYGFILGFLQIKESVIVSPFFSSHQHPYLFHKPPYLCMSVFRMDHHDWQRGRSRGHRRYDDDDGEKTITMWSGQLPLSPWEPRLTVWQLVCCTVMWWAVTLGNMHH